MSVDVHLDSDIANDIYFFFVPICTKINDQLFYAGFQTRLAEVITPGGGSLVESSRGIWFTKWGPKDKTSIRPSLNGWYLLADHEGDHVSVRPPFQWRKGKYRFHIKRMDSELVNGKPTTWVGCFVESLEKGEHFFAGAIRFDGNELRLTGSFTSFVEICGPEDLEKSHRFSEFQLAFGDLKINGKTPSVEALDAVYPPGVPGYANATLISSDKTANAPEIKSQVPAGPSARIVVQNKLTEHKQTVEKLFDSRSKK
jgi:hypothetical protein